MVTLTPQQIKRILPRNRDIVDLTNALNKILPKYDINNEERVAMFIGQCAHESNQFRVLTENLNYSQKGLLRTFRKYFSPGRAAQYARKPQKIANRVYANRMGNGSESSGDGWRYRGQGAIQLTGFNNHKAFSDHIGLSMSESLAYIRTLEGSIEAAAFWWKSNGLNRFSDRLDIKGATRRINGGFNGLNDRKKYVNLAIRVVGSDVTVSRTTLRKGDKGHDVLEIQESLCSHGYFVSVDGDFGVGTRNAIKQFQKDNGLSVDGVVGKQTREFLK